MTPLAFDALNASLKLFAEKEGAGSTEIIIAMNSVLNSVLLLASCPVNGVLDGAEDGVVDEERAEKSIFKTEGFLQVWKTFSQKKLTFRNGIWLLQTLNTCDYGVCLHVCTLLYFARLITS